MAKDAKVAQDVKALMEYRNMAWKCWKCGFCRMSALAIDRDSR